MMGLTPSHSHVPCSGRRRLLDTRRGSLTVETQVPAGALGRLKPDPGLTSISSPEATQRHLCKVASRTDGAVTAAWDPASHLLVGYAAVHPADPETRWSNVPLPQIIELGSLEVSRGWRGFGLSGVLLDLTFADRCFDDKIVISSEYVWHWDLASTGFSKWKYRVMLRRILAGSGFREMATDEPNVRWDPANIFMVRVGPEVSPDLLQRFQSWLMRGF